MDKPMSPYMEKDGNVKKMLLFLVPVAIILMVVLIFYLSKTSPNDNMVGRIVRIGVDGIGEVVEYRANHQMVVLTIGEEKERRLVVSLQNGESVEIVAESRDMYNFEDLENERKELASDTVESEVQDDTSPGTEIDWLAKSEENILREEIREEGKIEQDTKKDSNSAVVSGHQEGTSNNPVQGAPTPSVGLYDSARQAALKSLDDAMKKMSDKADIIDHNWDKYIDSCLGKRTHGAIEMSGGGYVGSIHSRAWFYYQWGGEGTIALDNESLPSCRMLFNEIKQDFLFIQARMTEALRNARISGLLPGDVRDSREKYRLEWDGWEE